MSSFLYYSVYCIIQNFTTSVLIEAPHRDTFPTHDSRATRCKSVRFMSSEILIWTASIVAHITTAWFFVGYRLRYLNKSPMASSE